MARNAALPILTAEPSLAHYLEEIRRFPMLERQEEYMLQRVPIIVDHSLHA
jgi:RNA polymerase sigma-32 factor